MASGLDSVEYECSGSKTVDAAVDEETMRTRVGCVLGDYDSVLVPAIPHLQQHIKSVEA